MKECLSWMWTSWVWTSLVWTSWMWILLFGLAALTLSSACAEERVEMPIAVFSGLDKITARTSTFEVPVGETVRFGSLSLWVRACRVRPPTEPPQTTAFVMIDEIDDENRGVRIFSGWMFAGSPGIHALEHPVFDVWLTNCKTDSTDG